MSGWTQDTKTYTDWIVGSGVDTIRITEDTRVRVTEDGRVRIIERFAVQWTQAIDTPTTWTPT
jgi:hypothetical protein